MTPQFLYSIYDNSAIRDLIMSNSKYQKYEHPILGFELTLNVPNGPTYGHKFVKNKICISHTNLGKLIICPMVILLIMERILLK